MASLSKFEELAGHAFENGLRLHQDSIDAYNRHSFATAYQLAITASEELGKAFLIEEYIWNVWVNNWDEVSMRKFLLDIFRIHQAKQMFFARHANEFLARHGLRSASPLIKSFYDGKGESDKQNSTFVGLTRTKTGKIDLNGRIVLPRVFAQPHKAEKQITLNNDFLLVYIDGFLRGIYSVDLYSIAINMSDDYYSLLNETWDKRSNLAKRILTSHTKVNRVKNPLSDWE